MNDKIKSLITKVCGSCVDFEYHFILILAILLTEVTHLRLRINTKLNITPNKKNGLETRTNRNKIFNQSDMGLILFTVFSALLDFCSI